MKTLFTFGAWTVGVFAPGVYRAYNVSGEIMEGSKSAGWTFGKFVKLVRQRAGWDWAWEKGVKRA